MQFDKGYISPVLHHRPEDAWRHGRIEGRLDPDASRRRSPVVREMIPLLEQVSRAKASSLLIIAEDIESEALAMLVVNRLKGVLHVCAVKAPGFGDRRKAMLQDLATLTGGSASARTSASASRTSPSTSSARPRSIIVDKDNDHDHRRRRQEGRRARTRAPTACARRSRLHVQTTTKRSCRSASPS
jgi:chaperonin GroEL